jgi:putative SOS response-associated peptidase YedK
MITTAANSFVAPIHDRMPAVLEDGEARDYLAGGKNTFAPLPGSLRVEDAINPLVKRKGTAEQGELF